MQVEAAASVSLCSYEADIRREAVDVCAALRALTLTLRANCVAALRGAAGAEAAAAAAAEEAAAGVTFMLDVIELDGAEVRPCFSYNFKRIE
eukprot:317594-Prorocentrum_minimum.AAC.1